MEKIDLPTPTDIAVCERSPFVMPTVLSHFKRGTNEEQLECFRRAIEALPQLVELAELASKVDTWGKNGGFVEHEAQCDLGNYRKAKAALPALLAKLRGE